MNRMDLQEEFFPMNIWTIKGALTATKTKWSRKGKTYFARLAFQKTDGSSEELKKVVVHDSVAAELVAGAEGRFYLFKSMGVKGLYGVRFADGREVHTYPGDQSMIFAFIAIVWLALNILYISTRDQVSILGLILMPLGIFGWWWCRKVRREIEQLWANDPSENGVAPALTPAPIVSN
ncbi:MAG: hypothetical protein JHD35_11250 [Sphingopyxis sp.]|nr:hypothetical protein [Sphingopyxis sp.]